MLTIDPCVNAELLEVAFERVQKDLDAAQPEDSSLGRIRNFSRSSRFRRWALDCATDLMMVRKFPDIAQSVLGLLTAGILVGMELQKSASEVGSLEDMYSKNDVAGAARKVLAAEGRLPEGEFSRPTSRSSAELGGGLDGSTPQQKSWGR